MRSLIRQPQGMTAVVPEPGVRDTGLISLTLTRLPDRLLTHHLRPLASPKSLLILLSRTATLVRRTPSNCQSFESNTPGALTEVPPVGVTADSGEIAFPWCDYEPAQAHRRVRL
jgi:hypothetical protein